MSRGLARSLRVPGKRLLTRAAQSRSNVVLRQSSLDALTTVTRRDSGACLAPGALPFSRGLKLAGA